MTKFSVAIIALSGLVAFAANNPTIGRVLNIARPDVKVEISGSVQRDHKVVSLEKNETVKAGEEINWNINSVNSGAGDAQDYRVVGQVPAGTAFVAQTAKGDGEPKVTYSIDGGKSYAEQPMIDETQPDGSIKKVAAPVSAYTQVMFEWAKPLVSQTKINAAYRVRVK